MNHTATGHENEYIEGDGYSYYCWICGDLQLQEEINELGKEIEILSDEFDEDI